MADGNGHVVKSVQGVEFSEAGFHSPTGDGYAVQHTAEVTGGYHVLVHDPGYAVTAGQGVYVGTSITFVSAQCSASYGVQVAREFVAVLTPVSVVGEFTCNYELKPSAREFDAVSSLRVSSGFSSNWTDRITAQFSVQISLRSSSCFDAFFAIGDFSAQDFNSEYGLCLAEQYSTGWAIHIASQFEAVSGIQVSSDLDAPFEVLDTYRLSVFSAPFSLSVASVLELPYSIRTPATNQLEASHGMRLASDFSTSYRLRPFLEWEFEAGYSVDVATALSSDWSIDVSALFSSSYGETTSSQFQAGYGLGGFTSNEFSAIWADRISAQFESGYALQPVLSRQFEAPYYIAEAAATGFETPYSIQVSSGFDEENIAEVRELFGYLENGVPEGDPPLTENEIWELIREYPIGATYNISVAASFESVYQMMDYAVLEMVYGILVSSDFVAHQADCVSVLFESKYTETIQNYFSVEYSLLHVQTRQWRLDYTQTKPVSRQWSLKADLLALNPVQIGWRFFWDLSPAVSSIDVTVQATMDHPGSSPVRLLSSRIGLAEGEYAWTGGMVVSNHWNWQRLEIDDPVSLAIGGETFALMIDNRTLSRSGGSGPSLGVSVISPSASFVAPRSAPYEKTWSNAIQARDAAEEALGVELDWQLVDWVVPGGRLAVYNATPLSVVQTIAHAAGGVVETKPDGSLLVRHLFPVAVPDWDNSTPDHILTDSAHNLSITEAHRFRNRVNRVTVRGYQPQSGFLSAEVDGRENGLNNGSTSFIPGGTAHFLVHAGPNVIISGTDATGGTLFPGAAQTYQLTEDLAFSGTDQARLSKPVVSLDSWIWLGRDLGTLTLQPDGVTVVADSVGHAIARVTITVVASSWSLAAPATLGGERKFPIQVRVTGTDGEILGGEEAVFQRGAGEFPGEDIADPLLSGLLAKQSRGRAVIDSGEPFQEMSLTCIHRPRVMPGHLVEVHDALMGRSWRGKVTSVAHEANGAVTTTALNLVRHVRN
jgi:hypothetical protein